MTDPYCWIDDYCWTPQRKILTTAETRIPFLTTFGIQASTRAQSPLPLHTHPDCLEIVFLTKGFQCYEVQNQIFTLSGGDIFVTYPGELHSTGSYPESISNIIWFRIDMSASGSFLDLTEQESLFLKGALLSLPRMFKGDLSLKKPLKDAFYQLTSNDPLVHALGKHAFINCLYQMIVCSQTLPPAELDDIEAAIPYIHDHLFEAIVLEDVAACCSLSLSRFKTKFKEKTGISPRAFINYLKVEQAKVLLRQHKSVAETADLLSFDTPNYFATLFKKHTGLSPLAYQKDFGAD